MAIHIKSMRSRISKPMVDILTRMMKIIKRYIKKNNMRYIPTIGSDSSGVRSYSSDTAGAYNTYITAKDVRDEYVKNQLYR